MSCIPGHYCRGDSFARAAVDDGRVAKVTDGEDHATQVTGAEGRVALVTDAEGHLARVADTKA